MSYSSPGHRPLNRRPIIGLTTYRKTPAQNSPSVMALTPSYPEAVAEAGGVPLLIPLGLDEEALQTILDQVDGLLLTGGGDIAGDVYASEHPELIFDVDTDRDRIELFLARQAVAAKKPLLAICRGHQVLNVALGGTLYEDILQLKPTAIKHDYWGQYPRNFLSHEIQVNEGSKLAGCIGANGSVRVNSLHHQGVRDLAPGLAATAFAPDGLVESVEVLDHPFGIGVQWHPENLIHDNPDMLALFRGLVRASAEQ